MGQSAMPEIKINSTAEIRSAPDDSPEILSLIERNRELAKLNPLGITFAMDWASAEVAAAEDQRPRLVALHDWASQSWGWALFSKSIGSGRGLGGAIYLARDVSPAEAIEIATLSLIGRLPRRDAPGAQRSDATAA